MRNIFDRVVTEPLQVFLDKLIAFLPNLFSAILIFIFGLIVGWAAKYLIIRILNIFRADEFADRSGIKRILSKGGVRESFSALIGRLIGWLIVFMFLIIALGSLEVPAIKILLEKFFLYIPNIFIAIIIIIIGYMLSNFFGRAALIAAVNSGLSISGLIGKSVKLSIFLFSVLMALEHLGIGRETVVIAFAIVFGGIILALSIAFGLGGKEAAQSYIEKKLLKEEGEERDDITHL
jgi:hypothetical protein